MSATISIYSEEEIDEVVYDVFDQFQKAIASKRRPHPSEEVNRTREYSETEIHDVINFYHVHCQLCDQHLFCQSVLNDINSFFQKHINTDYHKACKLANSYPDNKPILEWEKWLYTGHCNVCDISGIQAYLIDSSLSVTKAVMFHTCNFEFEKREDFQKTFNLLKKFCTVDFFLDKFIKILNDNHVVCLLCNVKLVGTIESARCHLGSNNHFHNFCFLIWKQFLFSCKNLLNGFNLELVTKWLVTQDMSFSYKELETVNEKKRCWEESNSGLDVYWKIESNSGFSPYQVETLLMVDHMDLVFNNKCLLCDVRVGDSNHMMADSHLQKAANLTIDSFSDKEKYQIYQKNRERRLRPDFIQIKMYNQLQEELGIYGLKIGMPYKPEFMNVLLDKNNKKGNVSDVKKKLKPNPPSAGEVTDSNSIVDLIKERLSMLENIFLSAEPGYSICLYCEQKIPTHTKNNHLSGKTHTKLVTNWKLIKPNFGNPKFLEPILKIKEDFVCLLCGVRCATKNFFCHIKTLSHHRKFEEYLKSNPSAPMKLSFKFDSNDSCVCTNCGVGLSAEEPASLNSTLKNVKNHWPCTKKTKPAKEQSKVVHETLASELESIYNANKQIVAKNQNIAPVMSVPCSACGKPFQETEIKDHDCKMVFDFEGLQKTLRSFMDVFENKIIESVVSNAQSVPKPSAAQHPKIVKILKRENTPTPPTDSKVQELTTSLSDKSTEKLAEAEVLKGKKIDNKIKGKDSVDESKGEKTDTRGKDNSEDVKEEVLVVMDTVERNRNLQTFFLFFKRFGKIKYFFFEEGSVIIAFTEKGLSKKVAKESPILIQGEHYNMKCIMWDSRSQTLKRSIPLHKDIVRLLENPQQLAEFVSNLTTQSSLLELSSEEKKREQLVCKTIISAVEHIFPEGRCFAFGSRLSGLFLKNSDFDVFLDRGGMYEGFKRTGLWSEKRLVREVASLLRRTRKCLDLIVVDRARVPIVSFFHKPTMLHCDLSFKNGLSVQNTLLLKFVVSLDYRIRPLILFLKHWADLNSIHGPSYFSSYAIAMMVIFYLEQLPSPILPTIETLQKNYVGPRLTVGGWDCNFSTDRLLLPKITNKTPPLSLLAGFFEYYATFDYGKYVISPLLGKPLPREAFHRSSNVRLPMSIKRHIINIPFPLENLVSEKINICVMDPFDLSHILTKSFSKQSLQIFVQLCEKSAAHLNKGLKKLGLV